MLLLPLLLLLLLSYCERGGYKSIQHSADVAKVSNLHVNFEC
jgi:hypothetical protein